MVVGILLLICASGCSEESGCRDPLKFEGSANSIRANQRIPLSMGYAGLSDIKNFAMVPPNTSLSGMCLVKIAGAINKAGNRVLPNVQSIVSAVLDNIQEIVSSPQCPGLGFCADLLDSDDLGAWPMTTLT